MAIRGPARQVLAGILITRLPCQGRISPAAAGLLIAVRAVATSLIGCTARRSGRTSRAAAGELRRAARSWCPEAAGFGASSCDVTGSRAGGWWRRGLRLSLSRLVSLRRLAGSRNRPLAALAPGRPEIFPGRGPPLLGAGFAGAVLPFWARGKHLGRPGPAGVTGPCLRGAGSDCREGPAVPRPATRAAIPPGHVPHGGSHEPDLASPSPAGSAMTPAPSPPATAPTASSCAWPWTSRPAAPARASPGGSRSPRSGCWPPGPASRSARATGSPSWPMT